MQKFKGRAKNGSHGSNKFTGEIKRSKIGGPSPDMTKKYSYFRLEIGEKEIPRDST